MTTMEKVFAGYNARQAELAKSTNPLANGVVWAAGKLMPWDEATIPVKDEGFLHSDLTYDVPAVWDGRFFRLDDHIERLDKSCAKMRLRLPLSRDEIKTTLYDMLRQSGIRDAFVELIVTRGFRGVRESTVTGTKAECMTNNLYLFVLPYVWVMTPEVQLTGGRAVVARTVRRTPPGAFDPTIKNLQWGDLTRAMFEAVDRDATYPFLTDGDANITEGSGFNVCFVKDGIIYSADRGVLQGVTRRSVFDAAKFLGIEVRCEVIPVELAYQSDEIFMSTTAGGVMPISTLDGRPIGDGKVGPITKAIWDKYWAMHWEPEYTIEVKY